MAIAVSGASPRAVRSRFVTTKICCWGESWPQFVGSTMGGSPSWLRPLAMAWRVAATHENESSYCEPEQLCRKLGWGAMFAGRVPDALTTGAGTIGGVTETGGTVVGGGGDWATVVGGRTGPVVVGAKVAVWLTPGS